MKENRKTAKRLLLVNWSCFQNEIIIRLIIETTEKRLFPEKLPDGIAVVVNDSVLTSVFVLEHEQPVILKYLAVEDVEIIHDCQHHLLNG